MAPSTTVKGEIIRGERTNLSKDDIAIMDYTDSFQPSVTAKKSYSNSQHNRTLSNVSISSATSTESLSMYSDDDSDDSDDDDYDDSQESQTENASVENSSISKEFCNDALNMTRSGAASPAFGVCGDHSVTDHYEEETEFPNDAPQFVPLIHDANPSRSLSFTVVDGAMVEVVPTHQVESVLPQWLEDWNQQRKEWEQLQKAIKLRRSRTHNDINHPFHQSADQQLQENHDALTTPFDVRRNRSEPLQLSTTTATRPTKTKPQKYGHHPNLPYPHARNPNPIVVKSSKKIGKKHARYALTAGMMLGIRESVGGALGVEAEIEIGRWEEWERCWEEEFQMDYAGGKDDAGKDCAEDQDEDEVQSDNGTEEDLEGKDVSSDHKDSSSGPSPSKQSKKAAHSSSTSAAAQCLTTLTLECERVSKYKFPPHQFYLGSNPNSPTSKPLPHKYKFKVYAPLVFARIRSLFGVEKQPFLHSICGKFNFYEFASNAKSGQFFFYSHDGRYMIKTLTYTESKFLREILPFYYRHLTRYPNTFLTHFYGMYRVCMPHLNNQRLHFIIMKSVFSTEKKIDRVWDLKGSRTGRKSKEGDPVGKDLDILGEGKKLRFVRPGAKEAFLEQLRKDATFLARLGIMDYSLLLGMHNCKEADLPCPSAEPDAKNDDTPPDEGEPCRSNTPFRRGVLKRAVTGGTSTTANDGFKALEELDRVMVSKTKSNKSLAVPGVEVKDKGGCFKSALGDETTVAAVSSMKGSRKSTFKPTTVSNEANSKAPNPITARSDLGIEGGAILSDGTTSVRELYYCGIIDILQYYNARKIGETVIRQAAGNSSQDISCVDPESYGKRFVKFISNLVEE